ncbi:MAG TPA: hypothetical protein VHD62_16530 [Opitutaceae bacterium]|nr:hypothetical protein [Opitutaceae bacterium]
MKTSWLRFSLLVVPALALPGARAAFNPALVPADSRWVVYADFNGLRDSLVGKELIAAAEKAQFGNIPNLPVGIDVGKVLSTIGSATAYGANFSVNPDAIDGTLVLQGTPDLRKIAEGLLLQGTIAAPEQVVEFTELPFPAYGLKSRPPRPAASANAAADNTAPAGDKLRRIDTAPGAAADAAGKLMLIVAFPPEPVILVSKSKAQILHARELARGQGASLAQTPNSPLARFAKNASGAFLFSSSIVPSDQIPEGAADGPQARILKMANSGSLALGESGADTFAHVELVATSDAMADKLMKILQGTTAMLSLTETTDRQLGEFLNATNVSRKDDAVTLALSYPSARLVEMMHNFQHLQQPNNPAAAPARPAPAIVLGTSLAEWQAEPTPTPTGPAPLAWRTIENVTLQNGTTITLGLATHGGRNVRFERVEMVPQSGGGALVMKTEYMKSPSPRANFQQFQFPGADGVYTLKVAYFNDPAGKATYAVSMRPPRGDDAPAPAAPPAPTTGR